MSTFNFSTDPKGTACSGCRCTHRPLYNFRVNAGNDMKLCLNCWNDFLAESQAFLAKTANTIFATPDPNCPHCKGSGEISQSHGPGAAELLTCGCVLIILSEYDDDKDIRFTPHYTVLDLWEKIAEETQ